MCCYRRDVIAQVGLVCVEGCGLGSSYILSLPTAHATVYKLYEVMCAVHVKYCNHLLAVDMAVWHVYS